jgi:hypothetical protein
LTVIWRFHILSAMNSAAPSEKPRRPRGRLRKVDAPIVPWDEVDRLLVFGEAVTSPKTGCVATKFWARCHDGLRGDTDGRSYRSPRAGSAQLA